MATKKQLDRVQAILESDEYEDSAKMARAVLKECLLIAGEEDSYVALTWGKPFEAWGPFSDKTVAKKFAKQLVDLYDGNVKFVKMNGTNKLIERDLSVNPIANPSDCDQCGHLKVFHLNGTKTRDGCMVHRCTCKLTYGAYTRGK